MSNPVPIDEAIAETEDLAAEAAVFGHEGEQKRLEEKLADLKDRKEFGEVFYIPF